MPQTRPGARPAKAQPRVQRAMPPVAARPTVPPTLASRLGALAPRPSLRVPGGRAGEYFKDVRSELRKVVWPSRQEALKLTAVVIGLSVVLGLYLGLLDLVFSQIVTYILRLGSGA